MDFIIVRDSDGSVPPEQVQDQLKEEGEVLEVDLVAEGGFHSLLDWAVFHARTRNKLGKKLFLVPRDLSLLLRVLLQQVCKEMTGNSDFVESDLIELEMRVGRLRKEGKWPEVDGEGWVGKAAGRYQGYMKKNNLVDRWEVMDVLKEDRRRVVMWGVKQEELEDMCYLGVTNVTLVTVMDNKVIKDTCQVTLDSDLIQSINVVTREYLPDVTCLTSFLRLLVSSRDELSLAQACTSSGLLTPVQFTEVKKEAEREGMPMYPAVVSFVRRVGLGGKSYQPQEHNGLYQFLPSLVEFNKLMEKLQTKLEETPGPETAVRAVITSLSCWLDKQGVQVGETRLSAVEDVLVESLQRLASIENTPAKGRMGRPATKLVVCLLDTLASSVACSNYTEGCTPARQKNVIRFLKTPLVETELDPFDEVDNLVGEGGLAERLGVTPTDTPTARLPAYPRFRCSSDFNEGSPVCRSRDKDARTGGRTLVSASEAHTPDTSDQNIQQILREVRSRDVEQEEMIKTKKTKRCLAKDVDAAAREKMGLDPKRKNSDNDTKKKEPAKKRKISTPKGQKKLTSFFMR